MFFCLLWLSSSAMICMFLMQHIGRKSRREHFRPGWFILCHSRIRDRNASSIGFGQTAGLSANLWHVFQLFETIPTSLLVIPENQVQIYRNSADYYLLRVNWAIRCITIFYARFGADETFDRAVLINDDDARRRCYFILTGIAMKWFWHIIFTT